METDEVIKNKIRLVRLMGSKNNKDDCLRRSIHNYLLLTADHRKWYDSEPQILIIPLLSLEEIKGWDGKTPYDVLVVAGSKCKEKGGVGDAGKNHTAAEIYVRILAGID
jgi:hypothetical protein